MHFCLTSVLEMEGRETISARIVFLFIIVLVLCDSATCGSGQEERVVYVKGGHDSVVWVVQLSDLHFSVYHPDRAIDFKEHVTAALSMINPSLVLITGDLTG